MRIDRSEILIDKLPNGQIKDEVLSYVSIVKNIIEQLKNPEDSDCFRINGTPINTGKAKRYTHNNGVQPIKNIFKKMLLNSELSWTR